MDFGAAHRLSEGHCAGVDLLPMPLPLVQETGRHSCGHSIVVAVRNDWNGVDRREGVREHLWLEGQFFQPLSRSLKSLEVMFFIFPDMKHHSQLKNFVPGSSDPFQPALPTH